MFKEKVYTVSIYGEVYCNQIFLIKQRANFQGLGEGLSSAVERAISRFVRLHNEKLIQLNTNLYQKMVVVVEFSIVPVGEGTSLSRILAHAIGELENIGVK
ncbi:MAG: hypothetical protein QXZ36_03515 [Thermoproteota archaeon]